MTGLTPATLYHGRLRSKDAAGNLAISGDFTQRARRAQFAAARAFIDSLNVKTLVVPGNHDAYVRESWQETFAQWTAYMQGDDAGAGVADQASRVALILRTAPMVTGCRRPICVGSISI